MYAAKMNKACLVGWKAKPKDPTVDIFVDLKNSPDPSCSDSSHLSGEPHRVGIYRLIV